jgi:hypothetical protein
MSRPVLAAALLAFAFVSAGCAGAQRSEDRCAEAFSRADGLLRAGLAEYVSKMKAFTAARDPEVSTAGAEARVAARADEWTASHRETTVKGCREWPEERLVCVLEARHASEVGACGLEPLVRSFTDEVVTAYAARPFDQR